MSRESKFRESDSLSSLLTGQVVLIIDGSGSHCLSLVDTSQSSCSIVDVSLLVSIAADSSTSTS